MDLKKVGGRVLHPKSNVMTIYIKGQYGRCGLISPEKCRAEESRNIDHYLANSDEMLLKVVARKEKIR